MDSYFTTEYQRKIFEDRYSQTKEDGTKETIEETFRRISLGDEDTFSSGVEDSPAAASIAAFTSSFMFFINFC